MKRTVFALALFTGCAWLGIHVWISGYEAGYEEGSVTAWSQARTVMTQQAPQATALAYDESTDSFE